MLCEMVEAGGRGGCKQSNTEAGFEHASLKAVRVTAPQVHEDIEQEMTPYDKGDTEGDYALGKPGTGSGWGHSTQWREAVREQWQVWGPHQVSQKWSINTH